GEALRSHRSYRYSGGGGILPQRRHSSLRAATGRIRLSANGEPELRCGGEYDRNSPVCALIDRDNPEAYRMKRLVLSLFIAGSVFAAGLSNKTSVHGEYIEARTADVYTGACFANSEVDLVGNLAVFGWHVNEGTYEGVKLDGLSVVGVVRA